MRPHLRDSLETGNLTHFPKKPTNRHRHITSTSFNVEVFCILRQPSLPGSSSLTKRDSISWIQCSKEGCKNWYHNQCMGILDKELASWKKKKYLCPFCLMGI